MVVKANIMNAIEEIKSKKSTENFKNKKENDFNKTLVKVESNLKKKTEVPKKKNEIKNSKNDKNTKDKESIDKKSDNNIKKDEEKNIKEKEKEISMDGEIKEIIGGNEEDNEKIIEKLAEILNISVEEIKEKLSEENIDIDELKNMTNINDIKKIVRKLIDVNDSTELLLDKGKSDEYKKIVKMIEELNEDIKTKISREEIKIDEATKNIDEKEVQVIEKENINKQEIDKKTSETEGVTKTDTTEKNDKKIEFTSNKDESSLRENTQKDNEKMFEENKENQFKEETLIFTDSKGNIITTNIVKKDGVTSTNITKDVANNILDQIGEKVEVLVTESSSEVKLQLNPESLGKVKIKLTTEEGVTKAKFLVETPEAKEALEKNISKLKDNLESQNVNVKHIDISFEQEDKDEQMQKFFQESKNKNSKLENIDLEELEEKIKNENKRLEDINSDSKVSYSV